MSSGTTTDARHRGGSAGGRARPWLPDWLPQVACAAWVVDPDGCLSYVNRRAESLLGGSRELIGRACHEVVRGESAAGAGFCRERCPQRLAAEEGRGLEAFLMRRGGGAQSEWYLVSILPVREPVGGSLHLVHLAHDVSRMRRVELFLREGTSQEQLLACEGSPPSERLSPRELEVLELLAHNVDLKRVAARLFISYATARNHVQHILAKLGVHSTREAVALHLLFDPARKTDSARSGAASSK